MLSKITKLIGFGVIIGLSGLCAWGSDDYEIWDGNGPMPTENVLIEYNSNGGIEKVIIFKDNPYAPELAYEEDETKPSYGRIGLKLNLPEELIKDCKHKYVQLNDETLKQELDIVNQQIENKDKQYEDYFQDIHHCRSCDSCNRMRQHRQEGRGAACGCSRDCPYSIGNPGFEA